MAMMPGPHEYSRECDVFGEYISLIIPQITLMYLLVEMRSPQRFRKNISCGFRTDFRRKVEFHCQAVEWRGLSKLGIYPDCDAFNIDSSGEVPLLKY